MLSQKEINKRYWEEYTAKSSDFYKRKMFELIGSREAYSEVVAQRQLEGDLHGKPTPHHWMYRLPSLPVRELPGMRYEFLIEYDIFEPHVGIYYGCKCISEDGVEHDDSIRIANRHWEELRPIVTAVLNNIFIDLDFTHRFKVTNNAENNTYWPFWVSLYEDEDIQDVGLEALKRIRDIYARYLSGEKLVSPERIGKESEVRSRFTEAAYRKLLEDWNGIFSGVNVTPRVKPSVIFEEFMKRALDRGWLEPDPIYGEGSRAYRFITEKAVGSDSEIKKYFFPKMIQGLREYMEKEALESEDYARYQKAKEEKKVKAGTPWRSITKIFLTSTGEIYEENNLRNSIRSDKANGGPDWLPLIEELMG